MWKKTIDTLYKSSLEYYTHWREHLKELLIALLVVLMIRSLVGVVYRIPTGSMIPTLVAGDVLVANRFYYGLKIPFTEGIAGWKLPAIREVEVGDLVIFRAPREAIFYDVRILYGTAQNTGGRVVPAEEFAASAARDTHELINTQLFNAQASTIAAKEIMTIDAIDAIAPIEEERAGDATTIQAERILLNKLNAAANFKRPLSLRKDEAELSWLALPTNYIFVDAGTSSVTLHLPRAVYKAYRAEIAATLTVISVYQRRSTLTFSDKADESFGGRLANPAIITGSVLATALGNSPFLLPYKYAALSFVQRELLSPLALNSIEWNFYPNSYMTIHREYVKRVVALAGDKLEIKNKQLWVNDQAVRWRARRPDPEDKQFSYFDEDMIYSAKSQRQVQPFAHPIRISRLEIESFIKFSETLWPLDTESSYAISFRDNFGPVIVPADHYFVMGDNRDESLDSRYIGFLPKWEIKGSPMYIFLPGHRRGRIR